MGRLPMGPIGLMGFLPWARRRFGYSKLALKNGLHLCQRGRSLRSAARETGVLRTTLRRKLLGVNGKSHGRPTALSQTEEDILVEGLIVCGDWGFPMTSEDVCDLVQQYLIASNKKVSQIKSNRPGKAWIGLFMKRNSNLTKRFCENIKRKRAEVSAETINSFFDNLESSLDSITPEGFVNYDETNFCDDPGKKMVIVRRGCRHPERIVDSSKSANSVMFSITGAGKMLPPYVVYKSVHLYDSWVQNGPKDVKYNRSPSGWFDMNLFTDWFFSVSLPSRN